MSGLLQRDTRRHCPHTFVLLVALKVNRHRHRRRLS
jgi:hypothetical protein